jgi:hypothetical protein
MPKRDLNPEPFSSFVQRVLTAQKAVVDATPKDTLEQISALSLLQARAGQAIINFRRAIDTAPLSKQARAELWQDFISRLPQ